MTYSASGILKTILRKIPGKRFTFLDLQDKGIRDPYSAFLGLQSRGSNHNARCTKTKGTVYFYWEELEEWEM
jgi:hypothetical protein